MKQVNNACKSGRQAGQAHVVSRIHQSQSTRGQQRKTADRSLKRQPGYVNDCGTNPSWESAWTTPRSK